MNDRMSQGKSFWTVDILVLNENLGVIDRGAGWRWCLVIDNDDGGCKDKVQSSGGKSFQSIVLYFRLFPNMGEKTHPFTVYDSIMQKVRVKTQIEIKKIGYD